MRRKEAGGAVCTVMRLALAGATAIASMGAWADDSVNIYGTADIWAGSSKELGKGSSQRQLQSGGMQTSYFGLSGSENLGDGLKAVFAIEAFIRMNDGQLGRYDGDDFFPEALMPGWKETGDE
ncbi:porin [Paenalcaligenes niemegkensis]|uniref:porin n=1 Tax=Paenalcaligenes niemegkensis TaxID=2895469 RepID=UPI002151D8BE|nr:porin [Paenalcaligenes niemegkensis]MCQ9616110.1 porin [Paenalcaligenes niemegkensis]